MVNGKAQDAVQKSLDSVTSDKSTGVAGLVFVAVDRSGQEIAAAASGTMGLNNRPPMTMDTVFWIASCTKLLATMACLQAVEQGKLKLDDHRQVYQLAPELEKVKVLQEDGSLVDKKRDITLRLLLSHTSGFGYEFFNTKLRNYGRPVGFDVFHSDERDILKMPLVNQPGETWEYGIGIDWAGILLERATGVKLNDWVLQNIMKPLDLNNRWPGDQSKSEERDHVYREPLLANTPEEKARLLNSAGAGAFAQPREYVQVLATLLNDGKSPTTGAQIVKKETVDLMWENQVPKLPNLWVTLDPMPCHHPLTSTPVLVLVSQPPNRSRRTQLPNCIRKKAIRRRAGVCHL
ncbi:beta-lactamase/transpeptidase-like protein [Teratosphaeria nubilosa]|uniref:Beta-lactamase/transpeptidase-like protein n=1 Tax=Teratosphaeria nubilosa TaxID=161662 RepID=A0A6G1KVF9_9PEZI|nr:beta-lactamase/transpeptidase-like protein [Teratosphaeria nubilosa]